MTKVAKAGDIFFIPVNEKNAVAFIASHFSREFYIAVYDVLVTDFSEAQKVVKECDPVFLCLTFDAFLVLKKWTVVGSMEDHIGKIPRPSFKVGINGQIHVVSMYDERSRPATDGEIEQLRFRGTVTPKVVDMAIKARFGIGGNWAYFKNLEADYAIETEGLV